MLAVARIHSLLCCSCLGIMLCSSLFADEKKDRESRVQDLRQHVLELLKSGQHEQAWEHQRELHKLLTQRPDKSPPKFIAPSFADKRIQEYQEKIRDLTMKSFELRRAGKHAEAEELAEELQRLGNEFQMSFSHNSVQRPSLPHVSPPSHPDQPGREHRPEFGREHRPEDGHFEERIRHLRQASENLLAAGFPEEAREFAARAEVMQHAQRNEREQQEKKRHERELQERLARAHTLPQVVEGPAHLQHELKEHLVDMHRMLSKLQKEISMLQQEVKSLQRSKSLNPPVSTPTKTLSPQPPASKSPPIKSELIENNLKFIPQKPQQK